MSRHAFRLPLRGTGPRSAPRNMARNDRERDGDFGDDGRYHVRPVGAQGSHQLAATASADAMAVIPDGDGLPAGADVAVLLLH